MDAKGRRGESGRVAVGVVAGFLVFEGEDLVDAAFDLVGDIEVRCACCFKGEADEFAAAGWGGVSLVRGEGYKEDVRIPGQ